MSSEPIRHISSAAPLRPPGAQARRQHRPAGSRSFRASTSARLWATARQASPPWLLGALLLYVVNVLASTWRWHLLLDAQRVDVPRRSLLASFLVAMFFNNFLPSNIGGDVIRIRDTAKSAGSKTLATTVVLVDRGLGLMALVLVAALGATAAGAVHPAATPDLAGLAVGRLPGGRGRVGAGGVRAGRLRPPAAAAHRLSSRVGRRAHREADRRARPLPRSSGGARGLLRRGACSCRRRWSCSTSPSRTRCT